MADRPATKDENEITPEMIEAAFHVISRRHIDLWELTSPADLSETVSLIYSEMLRASSISTMRMNRSPAMSSSPMTSLPVSSGEYDR